MAKGRYNWLAGEADSPRRAALSWSFLGGLERIPGRATFGGAMTSGSAAPPGCSAGLFWVLLTVAFLGLVGGCGGGELSGGVSPGAQPVPVEVARVESQPMSNVLEFVGTLEADEAVVLHSEITGVVKDILFHEGDAVKAGALLIKLDDTEQQARLREAEAQLDFALLDYRRKQELSAKGAISTAELDRAEASLRRLRAQVDVLKARLAKTEIRAPFAGLLGARQVSPGDRVRRDAPLVSLQAISRLKVLFTIPERAVEAAKVGQKVEVRVAAFPRGVFPGRVYFVSPGLNPDTRTLLVKAYVNNAQMRLKPGMFAEVDLAVDENPRALTIPESALVVEAGTSFVYRVTEGHVERVRVALGMQADGRIEVKSGLREGDVVVSAGVQKLSPGLPVVARETAPEEKSKAAAAGKQGA